MNKRIESGTDSNNDDNDYQEDDVVQENENYF